MGKRIFLAVVGAGIGSLLGLLVSYLVGGYNPALILGAVLGAIVPLAVLCAPGR
jgi:uncharacterized membrane protein YeaQ/YmgE (transglycosylase-associated protein family)